MIRVLHSVSNMDRAGVETMLMNYYRHMNHDVIQFDFLCNKTKPGAYDEEINQLGGRIFHTPGLNPIKYPKYLKYMQQLLKENKEYKVIEAHNGAFGVYALYAAKKNKVPVRIFHAHGASITKDLKWPLKLFCKSKIRSCTTHNYTCGVAAAEFYFGKDVVNASQFEFIPNAIEVEKFIFNKNVREKMREEYGLKDKHVIGHVGRFMLQKNHTFLLDVFKKYREKDEKAVLVLLGDGELQDKMKEKVELLQISDSVLFVGNVKNVNEWYQAFDVFMLPSLYEGLPVVGVEAQAADLPCIFSSSVTQEIKMLNKSSFLSLDASLDEWVAEIENKIVERNRKNVEDIITSRHYNIKEEAIRLQNRYLYLYGGVK